jgi:excisionase family DNA binding protein
MISINSDGRIQVGWIQNGIKDRRIFRSVKEAERFQDLIDDVQNTIKLCEEVDKFNRDFNYDPDILNLKLENIDKDIIQLKERLRIKRDLQKKLGDRVKKLAEQPRNVIDRETFLKEIKQIKSEINHMDRFFKEHSIIFLQKSLKEALDEIKEYFNHQKQAVKDIDIMFKGLKKEILQKFSSITTKDKVLSINEVAEYLGVSYSMVQTIMFEQRLPYFKAGNRYKIKENDLEKWIEKNRKIIGRNSY